MHGHNLILDNKKTLKPIITDGVFIEIGSDRETGSTRLLANMAKELNMTVQVHTPHRDKKAGTIRSMEVCMEHKLDPGNVIIDHNNEETVKEVLDKGFIAAFTIYPKTKMGNERMVEVVRKYGSSNIIVDSSADWGVSDPLAVPKTAALMLKRGIDRKDVIKTCYQNALDTFSKNGKMKESDWLNPHGINQSILFNDNSVLRGQEPRVDTDQIK